MPSRFPRPCRPVSPLLLALVLAAPCVQAEAEKTADDPAILELGDIKVPASYVAKIEKALVAEQKTADPEFELDDPARFRREIALKQLEWSLMARFVKEKNLSVEDKDAEERIEDFKKSLGQEGVTYEGFLEKVSKTDAEFRKISRDMLAIEKFVSAGLKDADVDQALKDAGNRLPLRRCSHILVLYKNGDESQAKRTKEEARKLAEDTLAKVKAGGDFAKISKEVSDDRVSNLVDGDLDWVPLEGKFVKAFADALYKLEKVDDLSGIIETDYGFHLIKLTGLKQPDEFKAAVRNNLVSDKFDKFLQQMREENVDKLIWNEKLLNAGAKKPAGDAKSAAPAPEGKTEAKTQAAPAEAKTAPAPAEAKTVAPPAPEAKTP
ncbi:MAG: peptidylprolyl isomerase [Planctomycetes bacterium]|nr:peptidylprolyl isomerase [Planctomycetota bacterium]